MNSYEPLPETMHAVGMTDSLPLDDPNALVDFEAPVPGPGPRDLLVQIAATSVNPVDTKRRKQWGPQDPPRILGWDAVGVVRAVGMAVTGFKVGDRVWYAGDMTRPGTNAEFNLVDERLAALAPNSLSDLAAAALPLTALTAWEGLFDRLRVQPAETGTLLVLGAAGGVGSLVIQFAKQLSALTVIATASRPESAQWCRELGADHVIDHSQPLATQLVGLAPDGVDFVFSMNTTGREAELFEAMAPQSQLVLIDDPEDFDGYAFKRKSIAIHWELMFTRSMFATADMARQGEILAEVAALADAGRLRSTAVTELTGLSAATLIEAQRIIESGRSLGKVVVGY